MAAISNVSSNQVVVQKASMNTAPDDVVFMVFNFADLKELGRIARVNKRWQHISGRDSRWQKLVDARYNLPAHCISTPLTWKDAYRFGFIQTALDQSLNQVRHCDTQFNVHKVTPANQNSCIDTGSHIYRMAVDGTSLFTVGCTTESGLEKWIQQWNYRTGQLVQKLPLTPAKGYTSLQGIQANGDIFAIWDDGHGFYCLQRISTQGGKILQEQIFNSGSVCVFPQVMGVQTGSWFRFARTTDMFYSKFYLKKNETILFFHSNDLIFYRIVHPNKVDIEARYYGSDQTVATIFNVMQPDKQQYAPHVFGQMVALCKNPPPRELPATARSPSSSFTITLN